MNLTKFTSLLREKSMLITCIFITLFIQIGISVSTMMMEYKYKFLHSKIDKNNKLPYIIGTIIIGVVFMILMTMSQLPFLVKQLFFVLFSIVNGLLLSFLIHSVDDPSVVKSAAIATIVNFVALLMLGFLIVFMGYDLGWVGMFLFIALMILIVIQIINLLSKDSKKRNKIISIIIVVLFSIYILYDTNNILLKYKNSDTDCIKGALDYYLDIYNLFTSWTSINN